MLDDLRRSFSANASNSRLRSCETRIDSCTFHSAIAVTLRTQSSFVVPIGIAGNGSFAMQKFRRRTCGFELVDAPDKQDHAEIADASTLLLSESLQIGFLG